MTQTGCSTRTGSPVTRPQVLTNSTNHPSTRSSPSTIQDIVNAPDQKIWSAEASRKFLNELALTELAEPMTPSHLTHVLFYVSQLKGIMHTACSAIRAAAFILRDLDFSAQADEIISRITPRLELSMVAAITLHAGSLLTALEKLDTLNTSLTETCAKLVSTNTVALQSNNTAIEEHMIRLQQLASKVSDVKAISTSMKELITSHNTTPQCPSYKEALISQSNSPIDTCPPQDRARAQATIKERQVLINLSRDHPVSKQICSCKELIALFQMALTSISDNNTPDLGLKSLTVLRNGGILLELLSKEAAQWVSDKSHLKSLAIASGGDLSIKTQTFNVVVPFFPISTIIEELDVQHAIEDDNKLPEGSIIVARWIKPLCRRENEQRVAHMMFHMLSLEAANFLIQEGLYHNMEHLCLVKDKKEPMCCLKCQRWGHMAKDCREHEDTCGTCYDFTVSMLVAAVRPATLTLVSFSLFL